MLEGAPEVLANPSLLAIEAETVNPVAADMLAANGFVRRYYDPFDRQLKTAPTPYRSHNGLYIRNEGLVIERLAGAKPISVAGMSF